MMMTKINQSMYNNKVLWKLMCTTMHPRHQLMKDVLIWKKNVWTNGVTSGFDKIYLKVFNKFYLLNKCKSQIKKLKNPKR